MRRLGLALLLLLCAAPASAEVVQYPSPRVLTGTFKADVFLGANGTAAAPTFGWKSNNGTTDQCGIWKSGTAAITIGNGPTGTGCTTTFAVNSSSLFMVGGQSGNVNVNTSGHLVFGVDGTNDIGTTGAVRPRAAFLAQPSITVGSGTGITVNDTGSLRGQLYKVTTTFAAFSAAALTADNTIATLPAKTILKRMWVDVTTKFIGGAVSAASMTCGTAAGGAQYIATFDIFTNPITRGLADADMGTLLVRAAAIQGGAMASFSATQIVSCRVTTVTANTNALTQGSATFYLETAVLP